MPLNTDKIDDAALALLYLTLHDGYRAWKGMIHDPVGKVKSVVFTQEGLDRAKQLFETMFKT
jgi:hypothetical protein